MARRLANIVHYHSVKTLVLNDSDALRTFEVRYLENSGFYALVAYVANEISQCEKNIEKREVQRV